ncbi:MAG: hypothetical protein ACE5HV_00050 [Acidobacteriota bacterium]
MNEITLGIFEGIEIYMEAEPSPNGLVLTVGEIVAVSGPPPSKVQFFLRSGNDLDRVTDFLRTNFEEYRRYRRSI